MALPLGDSWHSGIYSWEATQPHVSVGFFTFCMLSWDKEEQFQEIQVKK